MELLPESRRALDEYLDLTDPGLAEAMTAMGRSATRIVPETVALSVCLVDEDLTFTMVASTLAPGGQPGGQPRADGPQESISDDDPDATALDERAWQLSARATAALGIASTLSLPALRDGRIVYCIQVYAATPEAFVGRHQALADALGASALGAVTNSDLPFAGRELAARAPRQLHEQRVVEVAVGIIAARERTTVEVARGYLEASAEHSRLTLVDAAESLIAVFYDR